MEYVIFTLQREDQVALATKVVHFDLARRDDVYVKDQVVGLIGETIFRKELDDKDWELVD